MAPVRPAPIAVPEVVLDDLRDRLDRTRWPVQMPGAGWERGVPLDYLRDLIDHWRRAYDWRTYEARFNALDPSATTIDGQHVHFLHVRSPEPAALPLVFSHGWPGSIVEALPILGPLTNPRAYGADPADAFHLVVPSLPGYGFSAPTTEPGWTLGRIGRAFAALMAELGYDRYGAQGGDWGAGISAAIARAAPDAALGVHINMLVTRPQRNADITLEPGERERLETFERYRRELKGYFDVQAQRPHTIGFGLADSPAALLAWIIEKFHDWVDTDGVPEDAIDRDLLLTNATIYWVTNAGTSSAQLYYEQVRHGRGRPTTIHTPAAVASFPHDITRPVQRLARLGMNDLGLGNIVRWTEFDRGGHFAALERPALLVKDVRSFFRPLR